MNIPLVTTAPTGAPGIITPIAPTQVQAAAQAQVAATLIAQTSVDLSPLGRFLSAVTLFQKRMLELQTNPAAVAESEEALATVIGSVEALADSANELQASSITGTSDDQSLATLFSQLFDAQAASTGEGEGDDLAAIGLTFSPALLEDGDVLDVDTAVLQAALVNDPQGTAALLERAADAFGALAGVAPATIADPSILFADEPAADDPLALTPAPTPSQQTIVQPDDTAAPLTSDGAFFQELLAESPRPAMAFTQAPPPAVTEANANFEAQRLAEVDALAPAERAPDARATGALPQPFEPDARVTAGATPAIATAAGIAPSASTSAAANIVRPQPTTVENENQTTLPAQAAERAEAEQAARIQGNRDLAAQDAVRDANARFADTIAAEREASERIGASMAAERAAQAGALGDLASEEQGSDKSALARLNAQDALQRQVAAEREQVRSERARQANELDADELELSPLLRDRVAAPMPQPMMQADKPVEAAVPRPPPLPVDKAQQLARDPATLAAIAAYNLSAGPFAALNGRREIAPPRVEPIRPVENVTKVTAIDTDAATSDSSRPFR